MIVTSVSHIDLLLVILKPRHNARLALALRCLGARPVGAVASLLILCETIIVYLQLATSPEPSHVRQATLPLRPP